MYSALKCSELQCSAIQESALQCYLLQCIEVWLSVQHASVWVNTIQCIAGLKEVAIQLMNYIPVVEGVRRNVVIHGDQGTVKVLVIQSKVVLYNVMFYSVASCTVQCLQYCSADSTAVLMVLQYLWYCSAYITSVLMVLRYLRCCSAYDTAVPTLLPCLGFCCAYSTAVPAVLQCWH